MGYNGNGNVYLLPSKEVLKEFSNLSVGKLVEVSVNYEPTGPIYSNFLLHRSLWVMGEGKEATFVILKQTSC